METYMIILRVLHIFAGVLWAGWAFAMVGFIEPASRAAGPEGGKFMQTLIGRTRLLPTMMVAPVVVILTGLLMYWPVSGGLNGRWIVSGAGLALTIKSLAGILAFVSALVIVRPAAERLAALSKEMQSAGKPPSPQQLAELSVLGERISKGGLYAAILLAVTLFGTAVARFLWF